MSAECRVPSAETELKNFLYKVPESRFRTRHFLLAEACGNRTRPTHSLENAQRI